MLFQLSYHISLIRQDKWKFPQKLLCCLALRKLKDFPLDFSFPHHFCAPLRNFTGSKPHSSAPPLDHTASLHSFDTEVHILLTDKTGIFSECYPDPNSLCRSSTGTVSNGQSPQAENPASELNYCVVQVYSSAINTD